MTNFAIRSGQDELKRIGEALDILAKSYPGARIALNYSTPWELLVAVILSAQCTDKMVNRVTETLFSKYPRIEDYAGADQTAFERDIKPTGFFRNKARHIIACAGTIIHVHSGRLPDTMAGLLTLPGVARKTANIILGQVYGKAEGIAVDTHVLRIAQRLRMVRLEKIGGSNPVAFKQNAGETVDFLKDARPEKVETELMAVVPGKDWISFTYRVIDHGRNVCKARKPLCGECPLKEVCPVSR